MTTTLTQQENTYYITDSMGRITDKCVVASNIKEAFKIAKQQYPNELYFGKLVRFYNGGVRG
jgi:hypothetical protein